MDPAIDLGFGCWLLTGSLFVHGWVVRDYVSKGPSVKKTGYGRSERHGDHSNGWNPEKIFGHFDDLFARVSCCLAADASHC